MKTTKATTVVSLRTSRKNRIGRKSGLRPSILATSIAALLAWGNRARPAHH